MVNRAIKLLSALLIVGFSLYVFWINKESITVHYTPSASVTAPTAVILIAAFAMGILITALFSFYIGFKSFWREKRLRDTERRRDAATAKLLRARSSLASGDWDRAEDEWQAIAKLDPQDIVARVELSKCLEGRGEIKEAIKILDAARSVDPTNVEVLFRAAELNLDLGNKTAAIDNLALILYHEPNGKAARLARDLSESINRIEDALEYQVLLERLGATNKADDEIVSRIRLKKMQLEYGNEPEKLKSELKRFTKSRGEFVPALYHRALLASKEGSIEEAAKLLLRATKLSGESKYWLEAAQLWIKNGQPDRAVAAAKAGANETKGNQRAQSELDLIKLYINLNMLEEAEKSINGFEDLLKGEQLTPDRKLLRSLLILKGRCFGATGKHKELTEILKQLSEANFDLETGVSGFVGSMSEEAQPSPVLSTP